MHELFDDLDADDDQNFEQQELRQMMAQLGLDSAHARSYKWADALRNMDSNKDALLSKLEVIDHMQRVRMSKRQVADWLTHAVGLEMYVDRFLANSITGHDLPSLLEDGGDSILQNELGITSLLHRKQLRRAIVARLMGDPPPRPGALVCESGAETGSIVLSWDDDDDAAEDWDEDVTYRLRRQDPVTKEWHTVTAGSSDRAFFDPGLAPALYEYRLDAWAFTGVSREDRRVSGCAPKEGGHTALWRYLSTAGEVAMTLEGVGVAIAAGAALVQLGRKGASTPSAAAAAAAAASLSMSEVEAARLERGSSSGSSSGGGGLDDRSRSMSMDELAEAHRSAGAPRLHTADSAPPSTGAAPPRSASLYGNGFAPAPPRVSSRSPPLTEAGIPRHPSSVNIQKDYGPMAAATKAFKKWRKKAHKK